MLMQSPSDLAKLVHGEEIDPTMNLLFNPGNHLFEKMVDELG